jgi:simple sugar transport system permease protein
MIRLAAAALPVLGALLAGGLVLLAAGIDPLAYFAIVLEHGLLTPRGLAESALRSAPLLLLAASLMVSFSAGLWNLGGDGQFLIAAIAVSAVCPPLDAAAGPWVALPAGLAVSLLAGALWAALPAYLRAWRGVNEIITTLMMSFLGASLANTLIKLAFRDPGSTVPRTRILPVADRLPRLFGGTVHVGVVLAALVLAVAHLAITRTAWGFRLRTLGASVRAARHVGIDVPRATFRAMTISGALAGLAGGVEILGVWGGVRADWNPAYGLGVVALVCLARLNGFAVAALVPLFAVLSVGGESATIHLGVPSSFALVFVALMLLFLAVADALSRGRAALPWARR